MVNKQYTFEVLILVDAGIGNTIEALYALEYCLRQRVDAAIFIGDGVPSTFRSYIQNCYKDHFCTALQGIVVKYLIHGFTYESVSFPEFDRYFYVAADYRSTQLKSETEQFLEVVKALFPGGSELKKLEKLAPVFSERVKALNVGAKHVLYPGSAEVNPVKRWPHFERLMEKLGEANVVIIGGPADINYKYSYVYPFWIGKMFPQKLLNLKRIYSLFKKLGLMKAYAHWKGLNELDSSYINIFEWGELVAVFKDAKSFVGNDGGLMHLAAACGAKGVALFGPTSLEKNQPWNDKIACLQSLEDLPCRPCQFGVGDINMTKGYITCPYEVVCLKNISIDLVIDRIENQE